MLKPYRFRIILHHYIGIRFEPLLGDIVGNRVYVGTRLFDGWYEAVKFLGIHQLDYAISGRSRGIWHRSRGLHSAIISAYMANTEPANDVPSPDAKLVSQC